MFRSKPQKKPKIIYEVNNIKAFRNKIEPFPIFYLIFGLRGWGIESGKNLTTLHWAGKVYIIIMGVLFVFGCVLFIPTILLKSKSSYIFYSATMFLSVAGMINTLLIWQSNITTKIMLKILKKLDELESFVPNVNEFIHGKSNFFIFIHLFSMSNVLYYTYHSSQILNMSIDIALFSSMWRHWYLFVGNYSVFQFCNIVNIINSYTHIINIALCKVFQKPANYQNLNDPIMYVLKSKIIRYTALDPTKVHILDQLDVTSLETMYDILMDTVELANYKFSIGVRLLLDFLLKHMAVP